jgi:glutamyl-tRNA synthetase
MNVRVRIAPSPTGMAHIGTAHTALFNWLFARHHGGAFAVRIEDTDRKRLAEGAFESIMEMLRFLGLDPDEGPYAGGEYGPYYQSERLDIYQLEIERLLASGGAYHCYCTPERLAEVNKQKQAQRQPPGYDRRCRDLSEAERTELAATGVTPVVRLKMPLAGTTVVSDAIRGEVVFENALLQDVVLLKSDGFPTYHFAATVDDHLMEVTHVLRGDEWLPSTPIHLVIYEKFGWRPPLFAHLPLLLGEDKAKLSKRHGDTAFHSFVAQGYLPEALFNYLGLLGWSLDDHTEFISREEFVQHFDLDRVVKSPAVFDFKKLRWMNGQYIRRISRERFADVTLEWLRKGLPEALQPLVDPEIARAIAPLIQERIEVLSEVAPLVQYFFVGPDVEYDRETLLGKEFRDQPETAVLALDDGMNELRDVEDWVSEAILETLRKVAERMEIKFRDYAALVRVAITGARQSPPLTESMEILGKNASLRRLKTAVERISL